MTYGPLADTSGAPDVVLIRIKADQLMLMTEAVPGLQIGGKPQCRVIALAKDQGQVAASLGCTLSRTRTGLPGDEMTCAIPGNRLAEVVRGVEATAAIDADAESYAAADIRRFADLTWAPAYGRPDCGPATSWRPRNRGWCLTRGRSRRRCSRSPARSLGWPPRCPG